MEMGAPKTIKATVGRAESSTVTVYWRGPQIQLHDTDESFKPRYHNHGEGPDWCLGRT